jgi:glycosyltransferase involved in cell wall biosynthesis
MGPIVRRRSGWRCRKAFTSTFCFLAKQDQIREKLAISDVMLMPSELESFGLAALEGMACEVVPIATRTGGVPEVIEHGVSGFWPTSATWRPWRVTPSIC